MAEGRILAGAVALAAAGLALAPAAGAVTLDARVVSVVDGDTVKVRARGELTTVRLIGIDTPETRHPSKPVQCFGPAATRAAKRLLPPGRAVRPVTDPTQDTRDRWGGRCRGNTAKPDPGAARPAPRPRPRTSPGRGCDPNYAGACVPLSSSDLDCKDVPGTVRVVGRDPHRLDGDHDGWACESR